MNDQRQPWYRKTAVVATATLVAGFVMGTCVGGPPAPPTSVAPGPADTADTAPPAGDAATASRIGQPARDGKFEFTVRRLECGATTVGASPLQQQAQGHFCLLTLRVANVGDVSQSFSSADQKLLDASGTQLSADDVATSVANGDQQLIFEQINPGNAIEGTVVFDVPPGTQITAAQLHDSALSRGVVVSLTG